MKKLLLTAAISSISMAFATPFTGNDAQSQAMGNTGVASADPAAAINFNPALLATYPDENDFSMILPSLKLYVDDPQGFAESAESFVDDGGTWDQFQTVDSTALEASIAAVPTRLTAIGTDVDAITQAITDIGNAGNSTDYDVAVTDLTNASASLNTNANLLDSDVLTIDTQVNNLDSTAKSAESDLSGLSGKAIQLGLGIEGLSVALPSRTLGLALSLSNSTTVGAALSVSNSDLEPILFLSEDMTGFTAKATDLSASVTALAAANQNLTDHFTNPPAYGDSGYAAWKAELDIREQAVVDAQTDVGDAQLALDNYTGPNGTITNGALTFTPNSTLTSEVEIVGANIAQVGVSAARQFSMKGEVFSAGVTTKLQSITVFEKTLVLDTISDELSTVSSDPVTYFNENQTSFFRPNFDIGASKTWDYHGEITAGAVLKDIIPWTLETTQGTELKIRPKLRLGAAHETTFTTLSADIDVTENKPLKYGAPSRYLGIGGELRAWQHAAIRLGYRTNLSVSDSGVATAGLGLTPFGTGLDLSVWGKPSAAGETTTLIKDIGFAVQFSVNF